MPLSSVRSRVQHDACLRRRRGTVAERDVVDEPVAVDQASAELKVDVDVSRGSVLARSWVTIAPEPVP